MKKSVILILFLVLSVLAVQSGIGFAETKKVLVLHIIEENWDDLEFYLPKYDMQEGRFPEPITKKQALKHYEEYREKAMKKNYEIKGMVTGDISKTRTLESKTSISQQKAQSVNVGNGLYIKHEIVYLGKAYYLKEGDTFNKDAFRGRAGAGMEKIISDYYYDNLPEKVSLLFEQKYFDKTAKKWFPQSWNNFKEIRYVSDLYMISGDSSGNLKVKYDNEEYSLQAGSLLELPIKEEVLTRQEMMKFREKYFQFYAKVYPWLKSEDYNMYTITSFLKQISIPNESFHFGTKVTIINYGFEEIQGE